MRAKACVTWMIMAATLLVASGVSDASETDDRIESAAKNSYVFRTYLKGNDIRIESKGGVVTLTGTASDEFQRALAEETVASVPGVKNVENRLRLQSERLDEKPDEWIAAKVKTALLFRRNVDASAIDVVVQDGVVTLRGDAVSQAHKEVTIGYAKDVDGVKDVKDEMTVSATAANRYEALMRERIDDASITAQVRMALLFHRSTSVLNTEVHTGDGVVTLRGRARNMAEKDLVGKLVSGIKGVKDVRNEMSIEGAP